MSFKVRVVVALGENFTDSVGSCSWSSLFKLHARNTAGDEATNLKGRRCRRGENVLKGGMAFTSANTIRRRSGCGSFDLAYAQRIVNKACGQQSTHTIRSIACRCAFVLDLCASSQRSAVPIRSQRGMLSLVLFACAHGQLFANALAGSGGT